MKKDDDLKKIGELVKDVIRPLKDLVEVLKYKVDGQEIFLHTTAANVRSIKEQQSVINEKLDKMKQTLDANTASVITIEKEIKAYEDSYKINRHNIERVDTRLSAVEDELNIEVPEDLKVPHFADQPH